MKKNRILAIVAFLLFSSAALAADGNDWKAASAANKLKEMTRVIGNIKNNGCVVKFPPEYYVRQLNDFYATSATVRIKLPEAVGLIATGAGENWDC